MLEVPAQIRLSSPSHVHSLSKPSINTENTGFQTAHSDGALRPQELGRGAARSCSGFLVLSASGHGTTDSNETFSAAGYRRPDGLRGPWTPRKRLRGGRNNRETRTLRAFAGRVRPLCPAQGWALRVQGRERDQVPVPGELLRQNGGHGQASGPGSWL